MAASKLDITARYEYLERNVCLGIVNITVQTKRNFSEMWQYVHQCCIDLYLMFYKCCRKLVGFEVTHTRYIVGDAERFVRSIYSISKGTFTVQMNQFCGGISLTNELNAQILSGYFWKGEECVLAECYIYIYI